jgi:CubicO group peptidase (beta-lactamase class C family)
LIVNYQGESVVDLHGSAPDTPANTPDTAYLTFSVSKGFTTLAILKLLDEGLLELDTPIAHYWPAFGQKGKESATIRHALLHQAGIPAPHLYTQIPLWPFWDLVTRQVASYQAVYPPGTQTAYHLVNFGFILGEVVRCVTGMRIDEYLANHFFGPMGLNQIWMKVPPRVENTSPRVVSMSDSMRKTAWLFNRHMIRRGLIPAAGLHSNARGLAEVFQMLLNGGNYHGKRYLKPETIAMATCSHYDGYDAYVRENMNWGLGFIMGESQYRNPDSRLRSMGCGSSATTFGSFGMGTCMVWADRNARLVTAFTTNGMLSNQEARQRWAKLSNVAWDAIQACDN